MTGALTSADGGLGGTGTFDGTGFGGFLLSLDTVTGKIPATVTLSNLTQTFDATPKPAGATTNPPNLAVAFTYAGNATPPVNAGNYAVVGTINDSTYVGSANGTLTIQKGTAALTLSNLNQTYDGTAKAATATTVPPNLTVTVAYNGLSTAPVSAGTYAVSATIVDANYLGSNSDSLTIQKGTPIVTWPTPGSITSETALSGLQLNATANVPGGYVYSPTAGTVLPVGNGQALTVQFTPNDTSNYNTPPLTTVFINVLPGGGSNPPTAVDQAYTANENAVLSVAAPGLLVNGFDPNTPPLPLSALFFAEATGRSMARWR